MLLKYNLKNQEFTSCHWSKLKYVTSVCAKKKHFAKTLTMS